MKKHNNSRKWKVVSSISYNIIEEPKSINYPEPKMSMLQKLMIKELTKDDRTNNQ